MELALSNLNRLSYTKDILKYKCIYKLHTRKIEKEKDKMSKQETVEITVKLPKAIVDYLKCMKSDVAEYIQSSVVGYIQADIEFEHMHPILPEKVMEKYGLKTIFKEYGVLPCYYEV